MAKPSSREELKEYCLRKLGKPVLEINVDDDQIEDLIDEGIQYFHERHSEGIERVYLKHKISEVDLELAKTGVASTSTATSTYGGPNSVAWEEGAGYLPLPDHVLSVNKVFKVDSTSISSGLFNIKYQLFLNDLYYYGAIDLLNYAMVKTYLEDLDFLINPEVQIRFNVKNRRMYLDWDWQEVSSNHYVLIDCYRVLDPESNTAVYNDFWLKRYVTALIKKQWGQNLTKFQGVKLPGGLELNGRQTFDDAVMEIEALEEKMMEEYAMPPLDMIG